MRTKADKLARLSRLSAQMRAIGRFRLSAIGEAQTRLGRDIGAALAALESGVFASGGPARLAQSRLRALQRRLDQTARESDEAERALRLHATRAALAERAALRAGKAQRDEDERKAQAEIIDRWVERGRASQG